MGTVLVQSDDFSVHKAYDELVSAYPGAALATFTGYVRDVGASGDVHQLELEHYPGMTERILRELGQQAERRFELRGWSIIHRYGCLEVNEPIVWVGVVASHRVAAFEGCQFLMDTLKTDAPFWKREHKTDGRAEWVTANDNDTLRRQRW